MKGGWNLVEQKDGSATRVAQKEYKVGETETPSDPSGLTPPPPPRPPFCAHPRSKVWSVILFEHNTSRMTSWKSVIASLKD